METDIIRPIKILAKRVLHGKFAIVGVAVVMVISLIAVGCKDQTGAQGEQTRTVAPLIIKATASRATQQTRAVDIQTTTATATATTRPTLAPTAKPTLSPTARPTIVATARRTPTPTDVPTLVATDEPTLEPTAVPEPTSTREIIRPVTHIIKETGVQDAAGELTINNNSQYDGLVILATYEAPNSPIASGVIRTCENLTIVQIPDGVYRLYFCTGTDWLPDQNIFDTVISYQSFEDTFEYTTSMSEYTSWEVTLAAVEDGNASSIPVNADDFPSAN